LRRSARSALLIRRTISSLADDGKSRTCFLAGPLPPTGLASGGTRYTA
jgi:hypothetical protein